MSTANLINQGQVSLIQDVMVLIEKIKSIFGSIQNIFKPGTTWKFTLVTLY